MHPQSLEQFLIYSRCSINTECIHECIISPIFVKANEIKAFEHGVRTASSHCYKDISDLVLAALEACFFTERIFNWEIHRKDFGSVRRDLAGF